MVNAQGPLSGQRQHQFKLDGSYTVAKGAANGLNFGGSFHVVFGTPLTAYGYSFGYSNWEYYLTPRGSLGTGPADYEADVHIGYPLKLGAQRQGEHPAGHLQRAQPAGHHLRSINATTCSRAARAPASRPPSATATAGCSPNRAPPIPSAQLSNPTATAPNPDFLKAAANSTSATLPRAIRFGIRLTF